MELLTDAELVLAAQGGDRLAFDVLVRRHRPAAYNFALRHLKDGSNADDAVQEAFIRAYRGLSRFQFGSQFTSWLTRIVINCCNDIHKARAKDIIPVLEEGDEYKDATANVEDTRSIANPERGALNAELRDQIQHGLKLLSDREKKVFALRHHDGLSMREIGNILGTSEGAVRMSLHKATKKLREQLREYAEAA